MSCSISPFDKLIWFNQGLPCIFLDQIETFYLSWKLATANLSAHGEQLVTQDDAWKSMPSFIEIGSFLVMLIPNINEWNFAGRLIPITHTATHYENKLSKIHCESEVIAKSGNGSKISDL